MGIATTTSDGLLHFDLTITKFFLASITLLAPLTAVKVYNVTFAEIFSLLSFGIIGAAVLHNRLHISGNHDVIRLLRLYSLFLTVDRIRMELQVREHAGLASSLRQSQRQSMGI